MELGIPERHDPWNGSSLVGINIRCSFILSGTYAEAMVVLLLLGSLFQVCGIYSNVANSENPQTTSYTSQAPHLHFLLYWL